MTYPDGTEALVGDSVLFDTDRTAGEVVAVIADEPAEYSVKEPGVMVKAASGLIFIPASRFAREQVVLVERSKPGFRWSGLTGS